ncbi:zinc-ribbon domain-containing protein [Halobaculum sp. D14]|uniref:zinc-ribbon domain-containing protein n=1 Tax=Halobaculum sp. D14 TaxID=3421642 RepID=UPI003EB868B3
MDSPSTADDDPDAGDSADDAPDTASPADERDTAFCRSCGDRIDADAAFCPSCGASQSGPASSASSLDSALDELVSGGNPFVAAALSLLVPGLGQFYNREPMRGLAFVAASIVSVLSALVLVGFVLYPAVWLFSVYDAYTRAEQQAAQLPSRGVNAAGDETAVGTGRDEEAESGDGADSDGGTAGSDDGAERSDGETDAAGDETTVDTDRDEEAESGDDAGGADRGDDPA